MYYLVIAASNGSPARSVTRKRDGIKVAKQHAQSIAIDRIVTLSERPFAPLRLAMGLFVEFVLTVDCSPMKD